MSESRHESYDDYRRKGFAVRSGYGNHPALLVVDFINGFTDPSTPLGGDFASALTVPRNSISAWSDQCVRLPSRIWRS